jgi:hypothetical protein
MLRRRFQYLSQSVVERNGRRVLRPLLCLRLLLMHTFVAYIDEAGDEGFDFPEPGINGTSRWFILSAAVIRAVNDLQVVKITGRVKTALRKDTRATLHFRDMSHDQRIVFCREIVGSPVRLISILIHKPWIQRTALFRQKNKLYNYATRILIERISWLCHEAFATDEVKVGNGKVKLVFSNRGGLSYTDITTYLDTLAFIADVENVQINWTAIDPRLIAPMPHNKSAGLQIADAAASAAFKALQPNSHGFREERYARELRPNYYRRNARLLGYGLKLWPDPPKDSDADCRWASEL